MNKNNFWMHFGIAAVLVFAAAMAGIVIRSLGSLKKFEMTSSVKKPTTVIRKDRGSEPELLIRLKAGVTLPDFKKVAGRFNDDIDDKYEHINNLIALDDLDDADPAELVRQYTNMSDLVLYAEANNRIELDPVGDISPVKAPTTPLKGPNDPMFSEQWALSNEGQDGGKAKADISALKAWASTKGSGDVVVAVLDTGVDYGHTDLVENIWFRPENIPAYKDDELGIIDDKKGYNADANSGDPMDDNGHGTHCAGIIGAEGDNDEGIAGVNWKVKIMPLKFLGKGGFGSTQNAIEAINYAIDRKKAGVNIRVINASWGSTLKSKALGDAIRAAGEQGILFVAAAGNSSTDNDRKPHYPSNYDLPNVISVAALDRNDNLASFSNFGAKTVHIAAPGKDIVSTWLNNQYREASGTSMATPQVAGVAALLISGNPDIDVETLRAKLLSSVDQIDSLNGKVENAGRSNAAKALE
jgi:subtilisin family serine protease